MVIHIELSIQSTLRIFSYLFKFISNILLVNIIIFFEMYYIMTLHLNFHENKSRNNNHTITLIKMHGITKPNKLIYSRTRDP